AQRYSPTGIEKGYDVFAAIVRALGNRQDIAFHVVGGFDRETIDLSDAQNITFHGTKPANFFPGFYTQMDIVISPNISSCRLQGGKGSFDGFPTTSCVEAGVHGVAMFLADLDGMNQDIEGRCLFEPGKEIEIIGRDADLIIALIEYYRVNPDKLRSLAMRGREALLRLYSFEQQMVPRIELLKDELKRS
ncbi:glycosyltransferase, partial [Desulfovibrio aerotolerans]